MDLVLLHNASKESAARPTRGARAAAVKILDLNDLKEHFLSVKAEIEDLLLDEHNVFFEGI